ncbi:MAG: lysozyme inhibitor LprI family protein [Ferruginibacter sp.]
MKQIILLLLILGASASTYSQVKDPVEISPALLQKITAEVEKQVPAFRSNMQKNSFTADEVEFAVDTFRIEQIMQRRIDLDYSTRGMNQTVDAATASYDKLMNKYYNKLLKMLSQEDKKVLLTAQKAWLAFRDAEQQLIWTMGKDEYSGGGTIQSNIATGAYSDIVIRRTLELFAYYNNVVKEK